MSELALYRKYRPQTFAEVVGQEDVVTALSGAIKQERIAHAYIFAGTRGTGKTSIARIFSRALGVSDNDLYEIDAASNRGIDDIREIRDGVHVLPFESPYKVYIVDEVHMLTKEAWNALLKTLEEPPKHVIFILATTELEKIPETIISRCQTFSFKRPSRDMLKVHVNAVAKKEGYSLERGVAELIALLGDGSFRDTLGTLDKVIGSATVKKITVADAEAITGAPRGSLVNSFVIGLAQGDAEVALKALHDAVGAGVAMKTFAALVLEKFRIALMMKSAPIAAKRLQDHISEEDWKELEIGTGTGIGVKDAEKNAAGVASKLTSTTLVELLKAYDMIGRTYIDAMPLELAVITVCATSK